MKRNMDLIRNIMLQVEASDGPLDMDDLGVLGQPEQVIAYHLRLLLQADLIDAIDACTKQGEEYLSISLTWDGHEFLDAARDPSRWEQAKEVAGKAGLGTLEAFKSILIQLGAAALKQVLLGS